MVREQTPINLLRVAQCFHQGAFHELHATLGTLTQSAAAGRLGRREQALLLELAEYGLFYTCFYERIVRRIQEGWRAEQ